MAVNRCVCFSVPFEEVLRLARERGMSLDEIRSETHCGEGCGLCRPYLRVVLTTGETDLPVMTDAQIDALLRSAERANASKPRPS